MTMKRIFPTLYRQSGLGLPEIMVSIAIGLVTTLVIVQVVTGFEGKKRTNAGNSDAQTNGAIALYAMQRIGRQAGYGLPVYTQTENGINPMNCAIEPTIDHDADSATGAVGIAPVTIGDGGSTAGATDAVTFRFGNPMAGGVPMRVSNITSGNVVSVDNNLGCALNDYVLMSGTGGCTLTRITALDPAVSTTQMTLASIGVGQAIGDVVACLGSSWVEDKFSVSQGDLVLTANNGAEQKTVTGIVNIQAQYGIAADVGSANITQWVEPTGSWGATMTTADRNRIRAIRVAIVARNSQREKESVTNNCTTAKGVVNKGPCAWDDSSVAMPAPKIDLSNDPNWRRYRYRVYESIIALRNVSWSVKAISGG